jgi:hypothetical protein
MLFSAMQSSAVPQTQLQRQRLQDPPAGRPLLVPVLGQQDA